MHDPRKRITADGTRACHESSRDGIFGKRSQSRVGRLSSRILDHHQPRYVVVHWCVAFSCPVMSSSASELLVGLYPLRTSAAESPCMHRPMTRLRKSHRRSEPARLTSRSRSRSDGQWALGSHYYTVSSTSRYLLTWYSTKLLLLLLLSYHQTGSVSSFLGKNT
jgi:hypothetical protein